MTSQAFDTCSAGWLFSGLCPWRSNRRADRLSPQGYRCRRITSARLQLGFDAPCGWLRHPGDSGASNERSRPVFADSSVAMIPYSIATYLDAARVTSCISLDSGRSRLSSAVGPMSGGRSSRLLIWAIACDIRFRNDSLLSSSNSMSARILPTFSAATRSLASPSSGAPAKG